MKKDYVRFAKTRSLEKEGMMKLIEGVPVLGIKIDKEYFAYIGVCDHKFHMLCNRKLEDGFIVCPGHGEKFDPYSGEPILGLAKNKLVILDTVIREGVLYVEKPGLKYKTLFKPRL
jgi:nitrite reductase/ring-hydroxylating ferredoxin subunit